LSFIVHAASDVQRTTPDPGSTAQRPEQQSPAAPHVSPSARQPWRSAHVSAPSPEQLRPQQSLACAHDSPAGRQPAPVDWHVPAHLFEQHSLSFEHVDPPGAHTPCEHIDG
jgi:hypothetical protein